MGDLREGVDGTRNDQAEERQREGRLHEHQILRAMRQWHHIGGAERGGVGEAEVKVVQERQDASRRARALDSSAG